MDILCWCLQRLFLSKNERKFDYLYDMLDNSAYYGLELNQQNYRLGERWYRNIKLNQYIYIYCLKRHTKAEKQNKLMKKREKQKKPKERESKEREKRKREKDRENLVLNSSCGKSNLIRYRLRICYVFF